MKNWIIYLPVVFFIILSNDSYGQYSKSSPFFQSEYQNNTNNSFQQLTEEPRNMKAVYFEIFGNSFAYSFNFDIRFTRSDRGLGGRIGIGYTDLPDRDSLLTAPIMINYLLGKNGKYFEIGGGLVISKGNQIFDKLGKENDILFGTLVFAFRLQPVNDGFFFKVGLTPVFGSESFIPYWFGLSLGYAFSRN